MTRHILYTNLIALLLASTGCQVIADFKNDETYAGGTNAGGRGNKGGTSTQGGIGGVVSTNGGSTNSSAGTANSNGGASSTVGGTSNIGGGAVATSGGVTGAVGGTTATNGGATSSGGTAGNGTVVPASGGTAGTGNVTTTVGGTAQGGKATGGALPGGATSGGNVTVGGAATGGKTGVGGVSTGGVATGGAATGGVATGGVATGGVATGGAGTGGTSHKFVGGPCVVTRDSFGASLVYARGDDGHVYTYQYVLSTANGIVSIHWRQVTGIDASSLVAGSDLDCDGYPTTHITALGSMPMNAILHTTGTDVTFSAFYNTGLETAAATSLSVNTPGISGAGKGAYDFQIVKTNLPLVNTSTSFTVFDSTSGAVATRSPTLTKSLASGTDMDTNTTYFVAFTSDGFLMKIDEWFNMGYVNWNSPAYYPPPSGTAFQYSPTTCGGNVFVTAGDRLWHLNATSMAWDKMSDTPVASGPDCTGGNLGYNVAVVTSTGGILYGYSLSGTTGPGFSGFVDLGVY